MQNTLQLFNSREKSSFVTKKSADYFDIMQKLDSDRYPNQLDIMKVEKELRCARKIPQRSYPEFHIG